MGVPISQRNLERKGVGRHGAGQTMRCCLDKGSMTAFLWRDSWTDSYSMSYRKSLSGEDATGLEVMDSTIYSI